MNVAKYLILASVAVASLAGCTLLAPQKIEPIERSAVTFYVDYADGSDDNYGSSPETAFKHAPGDPDATGAAAQTVLIPGDTVIFKGGVHYRGSLVIPWSGTEGHRITFDGNTAGTYGVGPAVLDGGERITEWKRCASPADCGGNANWEKIYRADVPAEADALTANLHQDDDLLILAQHPNPSDPTFTDNIQEYLVTPPTAMAQTTVADARLTDLGGGDLLWGYIHVWRRTNQIDTRLIKAFDGDKKAVVFDELGGPVYPEVRYALANSLASAVFDQPGEYVFHSTAAGGEPTIYLWPLGDQDPSEADVSVAVRSLAVALTGENHYVSIQGFRFQNYQRAILRGDGLGRARGITIQANEFTRIKAGGYANAVELFNTDELLLADNYLHDCAKMRGLIAHNGYGAVIGNNRLIRMGRTPIVMYGVTRGQILANTVMNCRGMHSNGISVYKGNKDILIEGNRVYDSNIALTCQQATNLTIRNNIFDGAGRAQPISFWDHVRGEVILENNILIGSGDMASGLCITGLGDKSGGTFEMFLTLRNNIMDGPAKHIMRGSPWLTRTGRAGNMYLHSPIGYVLASDESLINDIRKVLPNVDAQDYARAAGVTAGPLEME